MSYLQTAMLQHIRENEWKVIVCAFIRLCVFVLCRLRLAFPLTPQVNQIIVYQRACLFPPFITDVAVEVLFVEHILPRKYKRL